ncbi:30S ribosomal protein S10 [Halobacteriales archaeon QS_8_69_26]|nr:MAG: 30S ribosomal protein S10 [Halobacteriales archaeon QS_8_69_26]
MTFVTRLRLSSGDRPALDRIVDEIRQSAQRKGARLKGPHTHPPRNIAVPQYKQSPPRGDDPEAAEFDHWQYTVYRREMEIVGHESLARSVATRDFPTSVHVEVEVERRPGVGG